MPNGNDNLAQIFYAAQMEAMKGGCDCTVCQLIRQGAETLTAQILAANQGAGPALAPTSSRANLRTAGK